MALTYEQSAELMRDAQFGGRVKVAVLKYAAYILDEPGSVAAHNTRSQWARKAFEQPEMVTNQVQPPTVMDAAVQGSGAAINDAGLQTAVETTVNKMM